jgi:hypothetical protein
MERLRLLPRLLMFVLATFAFGILLWFLVMMVGILVFGSPTPECSTNDTCDTFGDIVYRPSWLAWLAWFSFVGLLLVWPFRWVTRADRPIPQRAQGSNR